MPVFSGNTSTSALNTTYKNAAKITYFSLVNKTGGAVTVNVSILYGSTNIYIIPMNKSLAAGEAYVYSGDGEINLPQGRTIYVLVSGSVDYYFSIFGGEE